MEHMKSSNIKERLILKEEPVVLVDWLVLKIGGFAVQKDTEAHISIINYMGLIWQGTNYVPY